MKNENIEEGAKRIAIVIWFIWVVYIFFSDSFTYNINLGTHIMIMDQSILMKFA